MAGRYGAREFKLGPYWLGQRAGSKAWYRCWQEGRSPQRVSLGTADFEEAKQRLTDWFILQSKPERPADEVLLAEVIARYWDARGQHTSNASSTKTHCNYWLEHFGDASVDHATSFVEQERFKTALLESGKAPQTVNNIISTGRAAVRLAWKKGELKSAPPFSLAEVGEQEPMGRPLTIEEGRRLLVELPPHVWLLNVLLIGTLARPSAIMQLEWSQVDFEHDLINLNKAGRRQNKKRRPVVKMPKFVRDILWPLRGEGRVIRFRGEPVRSVRTAWGEAKVRAKLDEEVTLYSWRHTLSRQMRIAGVQKWEVQGQLGHGGGTTERYAEFSPDFQKEATAVISAYWKKLGVPQLSFKYPSRKKRKALLRPRMQPAKTLSV